MLNIHAEKASVCYGIELGVWDRDMTVRDQFGCCIFKISSIGHTTAIPQPSSYRSQGKVTGSSGFLDPRVSLLSLRRFNLYRMK